LNIPWTHPGSLRPGGGLDRYSWYGAGGGPIELFGRCEGNRALGRRPYEMAVAAHGGL